MRALSAGILILAGLTHPFEIPSRAAEPSVKFVLGTDAEIRDQIVKFTELLQKSPHDVDALIARAAANYAMSEIEKGDIDAAEAFRLAPQRWDSWEIRGRGYFIHNETKEAIEAFDKSIALKPTDPLVFLERGEAYESLGDHKQAVASITAAIEMKPTYGDAYFSRAQLVSALGERSKALSDFDRAVELKPRELVYRIGRAAWRFDQHEIEPGLADIKEAIQLNPGDVGANYQPITDKKLSAEALAHGEAQVERMLKDRPAMAKHVTRGDKIWTWAVRKFAGEDLGTVIDWNSGSPAPFASISSPAYQGRRAFIQVGLNRLGTDEPEPKAFDELWSEAVFELHNVLSSSDWLKIMQQASESKLQRDQYILAMLNSEERAAERARAFFISYFFPWSRSKGIKDTNPESWFLLRFNTTGLRETDLSVWGEDSRIPYYAAIYDLACARQEHQRGNFKKVKQLVQPLFNVQGSISPVNAAEAHYWSGCADCGLGDFDRGVTELTAALALTPGDISTLIARGQANCRRSHFDEALADFNEAIRTDSKAPGGYFYRGYELLRRENLDAALSDAQKALAIDPQPDGYALRAEIWLRKKEPAKAMADFAKAIELAPENAQWYRQRASAWNQQKENDKAIADWDTAIRLNPNDDLAYANRGWSHFLKKSYKLAMKDLQHAIELNPKSAAAYSSRAELLLDSDDPEFRDPKRGFDDAQKACELSDWKDSYFIALLAQGYAAKKDWEAAIRFQKKALENPVADQKEKWQKALEEYEKHSSGRPESKNHATTTK